MRSETAWVSLLLLAGLRAWFVPKPSASLREHGWSRTSNYLTLLGPKHRITAPPSKKELIPNEGGRFTACSRLSRQTQTLQGAVVSCSFTVSVLSGGSYISVLHAGSLLVANPYLALSWDPWVLVAYATDQRLLWGLPENINSTALIQKGVFWKCASNGPRKFLHLWYRLGIAEQKRLLHISLSFWLKSSTQERQRNSTIVSRHCNLPRNIFWEVMVW